MYRVGRRGSHDPEVGVVVGVSQHSDREIWKPRFQPRQVHHVMHCPFPPHIRDIGYDSAISVLVRDLCNRL